MHSSRIHRYLQRYTSAPAIFGRAKPIKPIAKTQCAGVCRRFRFFGDFIVLRSFGTLLYFNDAWMLCASKSSSHSWRAALSSRGNRSYASMRRIRLRRSSSSSSASVSGIGDDAARVPPRSNDVGDHSFWFENQPAVRADEQLVVMDRRCFLTCWARSNYRQPALSIEFLNRQTNSFC
jgi:hypothetical protein